MRKIIHFNIKSVFFDVIISSSLRIVNIYVNINYNMYNPTLTFSLLKMTIFHKQEMSSPMLEQFEKTYFYLMNFGY